MEEMSLKRLAEAIGADCKCADGVMVNGVCIDTRKLQRGNLFVAIKGERVNGHDFIERAFSLGAAGVISLVPISGHDEVIVVPDTVKALMQLAKYYRSLFSIFAVGITGSVGKTSTKEMVYTILSYNEKTLKTSGNANNEIGLPLTVFELNSSYKNAVFEMGMSNFGEIRELSDICRPSVAVITNIGVSHIETLGSRENILKAKLEISEKMSHDSPIILNGDDDMLKTVSASCEHPILYYGIENSADIMASDIEIRNGKTHFNINFYGKSLEAVIPTIGKHNVYNALAGFCVGLVAEMRPEDIIKAMYCYQNSGMRQSASVINGITVIADCYNASPNSMNAALDVITSTECMGKRVCVFGDMLELGDISEEAHIEIGRCVARFDIDCLYCFGESARGIKRGAVMAGMKKVFHFSDKKELAEQLAKMLSPGDAVIFKASRGMEFETIIELFTEKIRSK